MAELEIHHETAHSHDPAGQRVGILAAILAVLLAVVTIASHRTHTAAIIHKSTANDDWAHYQSARIKYHNVELGQDLVRALGGGSAAGQKLLADYAGQLQKYGDQAASIQTEAQRDDAAAEADESRGLRYDIGEGLLEIALVLSSLFFIARKAMFPLIGVAAGIAGVMIALAALV